MLGRALCALGSEQVSVNAVLNDRVHMVNGKHCFEPIAVLTILLA